jgi:hypothetical protein
MDCEERDRLLENYRAAVMEGSSLTLKLSEVAGINSPEIYKSSLRALRQAGGKVSGAKLAFERHLAEHGCAFDAPK